MVAETIAEEWKVIPDFPDYEVSSFGRVRSNRRPYPRIMSACRDTAGYARAKIRNEQETTSKRVCNLICRLWHGEPVPGQQARHLDGNNKNDQLSNLSWGFPVENKADSVAHGTYIHGTRHHSNKLTEAQVLEIRASSASPKHLGPSYGVTPAMISHIRTRRKWKHLP